MTGRRALLAGLALLPGAARAALPVPGPGRLAFRVVRNGSAIGQHVLTFTQEDTRLTVQVAVDLSVGIGPITLYRYRHRATERWDAGRVTACSAETDDDGSRSTVVMRREGDALLVESSRAGRYTAPSGALPATHWNRAMLDGPFINTQTGAVMRPSIRRAGIAPLPWSPQRQAERFVLSGDVDIETWYDASPAWVGLRFSGSDGSSIHYEAI